MGASKFAHDCISAARTGIQDRSHHSRSAAAQAGLWLGRQPQELDGRSASRPQPPVDYIRRVRQQFLQAGYPVISVDTKNKELVGNFANKGRTWRQTPAQVNLHDFPGDALGRAVPYGIYDILHNQGYVYLGNSYDTPEFAVHAIAQWWADPARPRFQREDKILILCDAGGSNNCRSWLWKAELQRQCADRFGISVLVCHYPTGASKYNPIEYRLFSQITRNWAGKPLRSFDTMRNYIRSTTTTTGLTVKAFLVDRAFQKGRKVSKGRRRGQRVPDFV